ncbi:PXA domain-containing protein, partial [Gorgonomyces haynaldii]
MLLLEFSRFIFGGLLLSSLLISYFGFWNLIQSLYYHLSIIVAVIVIYGLVYAGNMWFKDDDRKESLFVVSKSDRSSRIKRQYPLASKNGWIQWLESRKNEKITPANPQYMPNTSMQLLVNELIVYVTRDFLQSWYQSISHDPVWISKAELVLHFCFAELSHRVQKTDFVHLILSRGFPILVQHIQNYKNAEALLRGSTKSGSQTDPNYDDSQLAKHYRLGRLHPAIRNAQSKEQEYTHIRSLLKDIVPKLLPRSEVSSRIMLILLREILTTCLLQPLIDSLSEPDYWNQTFDSLADQLSNDFQSLHGFDIDQMDTGFDFDQDDLPSFEDFITHIRLCSNLVEAERIRDRVLAEVEGKKHELERCEDRERQSKLRLYLKRLNTCQTQLDKRIWYLMSHPNKQNDIERFEFDDILADRMLYAGFLDFMEQRQKQDVLLFWRQCKAIQSSFPQEDADLFHFQPNIDTTALALNMQQLYEDYLKPGAESQIMILSPHTLDVFQEIRSRFGTEEKERKVLLEENGINVLYQAMDEVYNHMLTEDYPKYLKSQQYSKIVRNRDDQMEMPVWDELSEEGSPKKKLGQKFMDVFQKRHRHHTQESDLIESPRKIDKSDNVEQEMDLLLNEDNAFSVNIPSTDEDMRTESSPENKTSVFHLKKISKDDLKSFSSKFFKDRKRSWGSKKSPEKPTITLTQPETRFNEMDSILEDSIQSDLPSMIIPPKSVTQLIENITKLKNDIKQVNKNVEHKKEDKTQHYILRGMWHELTDLLKEKSRLEMEELEDVISPSSIKISIGESLEVSDDGKDYAVYPIQVTRTNAEGNHSGWLVTRRYSQFSALHQQLKSKYPHSMSQIDLPGKMINGLMKLRKQLLESRRVSLEKYLTSIIKHQDICKSSEFRKFIAHPDILRVLYPPTEDQTKKSFLKNIMSTVDESFDLFRRRLSQTSYMESLNSSPSPTHPMNTPAMSETVLPFVQENASATTALTDLFVELFELREKSNWLRRQAVVLFLQQFFGDTVERRTTEAIKSIASQENAHYLLNYTLNTYWPQGQFVSTQSTRTDDQKLRTRTIVRKKLLYLAKNLGGVLGKQNTLSGALRWFNMFQNKRLNQHLIYTFLDEILQELFK